MAERNLGNCAKILKSLSEGIRLRIIKCLFNGEYSVSEIARMIGVDYSQVSHHLGVLRNAGIVIDRRDGKYILYRINPVLHNNFKQMDTLDFQCCSIGFNNQGDLEGKKE